MDISGEVVKGNHVGTKLGFPTANLDRRSFSRRKLKIKLGVYAGFAEFKIKNLKLKIYPAAIVIGPIDKKGLPKLEAHLIGFKGNLYGQKIKLELVKYLRGFRKYASDKVLIKQIKEDVKRVQVIIKHQEIL